MVDFEEGFRAFLVAGSALVLVFVVVAFVGLAATLGSLASFFTVVLFAASLDPLVVSFSLVGFLVEDFVALVAVVIDLDLVVDLAGAFLEAMGLDVLAGLFCSGGLASLATSHRAAVPSWCQCHYS